MFSVSYFLDFMTAFLLAIYGSPVINTPLTSGLVAEYNYKKYDILLYESPAWVKIHCGGLTTIACYRKLPLKKGVIVMPKNARIEVLIHELCHEDGQPISVCHDPAIFPNYIGKYYCDRYK